MTVQQILQTALQHHQTGRWVEAEQMYREALAREPKNASAMQLLGLLLHQKGMNGDAVELLEKAHRVARPSAFSLNSLGAAYLGLSRPRDARKCFSKALTLQPDYPEAHSNLGIALKELGQPREAEQSYRRAIALKPDYAEAHNNLANLLEQSGRLTEAEQSYRQTLMYQPQMIEALAGLGDVLLALGRAEEAEPCFRRIVELDPGLADAHHSLGATLKDLGRLEEAEQSIRRAIELNPDIASANYSLGNVLYELGRLEEAERCYRRELELQPDFAAARWAATLIHLPPLCAQENNAAALEELRGLDAWFDAKRIADGIDAVGAQQPFFLAYLEKNNRELLRVYGELCARLMKHWQAGLSLPRTVEDTARKSDSRIKVGIVSGHICDHPVWNAILKGWMQHLDRERFDLRIFHTGTRQDQETVFARSRASNFEEGKRSPRDWAALIAGQQLDAIIYPEIGMDPLTLQLASLRLAPVQAAAWGHPETTGLPTIDYYLSADLLEPTDAQNNYTEQLVRLPNLGCCYPPLSATHADFDFAEFGIASVDANTPLFVCPGTPFKYSPQHDRVLVEIARELGKCRFVLFTHRQRHLSEQLHQRLRSAFASAGMEFDRHGVFIPWQPRAKFFGLLKRADLMLDTIGFSGFNTAMQAVECGLPIVTRDGRFMRGRFASAILKRMGLVETVAADEAAYIALALRLAKDQSFRNEIQTRIETSRGVLFEDTEPVKALEEFLTNAVRAS